MGEGRARHRWTTSGFLLAEFVVYLVVGTFVVALMAKQMVHTILSAHAMSYNTKIYVEIVSALDVLEQEICTISPNPSSWRLHKNGSLSWLCNGSWRSWFVKGGNLVRHTLYNGRPHTDTMAYHVHSFSIHPDSVGNKVRGLWCVAVIDQKKGAPITIKRFIACHAGARGRTMSAQNLEKTQKI